MHQVAVTAALWIAIALRSSPFGNVIAQADWHARAVTARQAAGSLDALHFKTGWIMLGVLTADRRQWAAGNDPGVAYKTGAFEILGRPVDRRRAVLPKVGDRIRITTRLPVVIVDYATAGEQRRLTAPSAVTSIDRPLGPADRTGAYVEAGDVLRVCAVSVSRRLGETRVVEARVSPAMTSCALH